MAKKRSWLTQKIQNWLLPEVRGEQRNLSQELTKIFRYTSEGFSDIHNQISQLNEKISWLSKEIDTMSVGFDERISLLKNEIEHGYAELKARINRVNSVVIANKEELFTEITEVKNATVAVTTRLSEFESEVNAHFEALDKNTKRL